MKLPYPKETELHVKFSVMSLEDLKTLEVFIRNSANASYAGGAQKAGKEHQKKHEIVQHYLNKL